MKYIGQYYAAIRSINRSRILLSDFLYNAVRTCTLEIIIEPTRFDPVIVSIKCKHLQIY